VRNAPRGHYRVATSSTSDQSDPVIHIVSGADPPAQDIEVQ
jgi:hypothetical protein